MRKRTLITSVAIIWSLFLAGCGLFFDKHGFEDAVETSYETGDFTDYNAFVCEEDLIPYVTAYNPYDVSVNCRTSLDSVICDVESATGSESLTAEIDEDLKACNVVAVLDGGEIRLRELLETLNNLYPATFHLSLENALQKMFNEGDLYYLNAITCEAEQLSQEAAGQFTAMNVEWTVDCFVQEDSFVCYIDTEGVDLVFSGVLTGDIEENLLCNSVLTINGQDVPLGGHE